MDMDDRAPLHEPGHVRSSRLKSITSRTNINRKWRISILSTGLITGCGAAYWCVQMGSQVESDWPITMGVYGTLALIAWVLFLIYDLRVRPHRSSLRKQLSMLGHTIPGCAVLGAAVLVQISTDYYLVWLGFLLVFRYWRTAVQIFY